MSRIATALFGLVVLLAPSALAQQQVTVREIHDVPEENIQYLIDNALTLTRDSIQALIESPFEGDTVEVTVVVLSDPYRSGERTPDEDPLYSQYFVRDTAAASAGFDGMGIFVNDQVGVYADNNLRVGRVYTMQAVVDPFRGSVQLAPLAVEDLGPYQALGLPDAIVEPVTVTTDELNAVVAPDNEQYLQLNWANYERLVNQFVRIEDARVIDRTEGNRPSFLVSTVGEESAVATRDLSLRYRNDRYTADGSGYLSNPDFAQYVRNPDEDPYIAPGTNSIVNLQGFVDINFFDPFSITTPRGAAFRISPWVDEDVEIVEAAPVVGSPSRPADVPGDGPVTIEIEATASGSRTITGATLDYAFSSGETGQVALTDDGLGTFSGDIPAAPDGDFVTYSVTVTDSEGSEAVSDESTYRVLYGGITSIAQVQTTADLGAGASPFDGITTERINLTAVVQTTPEEAGFLTIQDAEGAWNGIEVRLNTDVANLGLVRGDQVTITGATISENMDSSFRRNRTTLELEAGDITVTSGAATPYDYATLPTGALAQDEATREAFESVMVQFQNVTVTSTNADGPDRNFGEFLISSTGDAADAVRVDDESDGVPFGFNDSLEVGQEFALVRGVWSYAFSDYKLWPVNAETDIVTTVSNEVAGPGTGRFALEAAFPNPFRGTATLNYEIAEAGPVSITVYDVTGRAVATLVDQTLAAQAYTATLDGSRLPAGVYFVRLAAGAQRLTQKVVLVK